MFALLAAIMLLAPARPDPSAPPTPQQIARETPEQYVHSYTPEWIDREALLTALKDAGTNWAELALALDGCRPPGAVFKQVDDFGSAYQNMLWLIESAPHLDRLELTAPLLLENMTLALEAARERNVDPDSDYFRRYMLNYRLDDEPVTNWRGELARRYRNKLDGKLSVAIDPYNIRLLASAACAGFKTLERGYFGNLADPISVDNSRAGSERELTLLCAAVLRAMGWGVRYAREGRSSKSWVEVYVGPNVSYSAEAWLPVYPTAPQQTADYSYAKELCGGEIGVVTAGDAFAVEQVTPRYTAVSALAVRIMRGGVEDKEFKHWSIEAWYDGRYVPLDDISAADDAANPISGLPTGHHPARGIYYVGAPGEYLLTAGVRYPGGYVHLVTQTVQALPGAAVAVELCIDPPVDLPVAAMAERTVGEGVPQVGTLLYVVIDEKEPSDHTLRLLEPFRNMDSLQYQVLEAHASDDQAAALLAALQVVPEDLKPVVILLREGKTLLYQRGYNLNIYDWVKRALGE